MSAIFGNYSPAFCSNPFVVTTTNAVMLSLSKHLPIYNQSFDKLKMTATKSISTSIACLPVGRGLRHEASSIFEGLTLHRLRLFSPD
jgi:hypothetical protein